MKQGQGPASRAQVCVPGSSPKANDNIFQEGTKSFPGWSYSPAPAQGSPPGGRPSRGCHLPPPASLGRAGGWPGRPRRRRVTAQPQAEAGGNPAGSRSPAGCGGQGGQPRGPGRAHRAVRGGRERVREDGPSDRRGSRRRRRQPGVRRPDPCPTWSPLIPPIPHPPASGSLAWIKGIGIFPGAAAEGCCVRVTCLPACVHVCRDGWMYMCACVCALTPTSRSPSAPALHKERAGGKQNARRKQSWAGGAK